MLGFPYLWLVSVTLYCPLSLVCILLYQMLPDCLLLCQQCYPYSLVRQAVQKSMATTQVIDFSTPLGRWTFIVTSEIICQCRMAKFTLLNCYFIANNALLFIERTKTLNFDSYSSEHSMTHFVSSYSAWSLIPNLFSSKSLESGTLNLIVLNSVIKGLFPIPFISKPLEISKQPISHSTAILLCHEQAFLSVPCNCGSSWRSD